MVYFYIAKQPELREVANTINSVVTSDRDLLTDELQ